VQAVDMVKDIQLSVTTEVNIFPH